MTATLEVSGCAPPMPSICRVSGLPMMRSSRSSRSAGSAGRSPARKYAPFDVPPRISMHRTPSAEPIRGSFRHVLHAARGELVSQPVQVQAELAAGQGLADLLLPGHPGPRGGQGLADVAARHAHHAVVVGDDRVAGPDDLPADRYRNVDRARRLLDRALGAHRRRPDTEAHRAQVGHAPRTPSSMTRPRTPRTASEVASSSPNIPSVDGDVVVTTSRSPAWHCSAAAWIIRLSPGQHSAVTAVPPTRLPSWMGRSPGPRYPARPIASCTVATPSSARASTTARSARATPVTITLRISSACP